MTWTKFLQMALGALLVVVPVVIGLLILLAYSSSAETKEFTKSVTTDVLLPMFEAVLTLLAATATVKALFTAVNNQVNKNVANFTPQSITLFDW